jgi:hypothetical protein
MPKGTKCQKNPECQIGLNAEILYAELEFDSALRTIGFMRKIGSMMSTL